MARHADGCQLQLGLRATGYWLVFVNYGDQCVCGEHVQLVDVDVTAPGVPEVCGCDDDTEECDPVTGECRCANASLCAADARRA